MTSPLRHSTDLPPPLSAVQAVGPKPRLRPSLVSSYERLADVFHAVLSEHSLDALLDRIADEVGELIPHDSLTIFRADEQERLLIPVLARDPWAEQILETTQGFGVGITGWAVEHREAVLANQAHLDPRVRTVPGTPADEEEALISVPLVARGSVKGALDIYRAGDDAFTDLEFHLAKRFAEAAALALDNAETTAALKHQARTDSLTGLFNHSVFHERLREELIACNSGSSLAVVMLDLDDFKHLNDTSGHATGDRVLKAAAECISRCSRAEDIVCRIGGEEFAVILPSADAGAAGVLASRIQGELEIRATSVAGRRLTASIGIAQAPEHSRNASELAAYADAAMLEAKCRGKNRVVVFDGGAAGAVVDGSAVPNVRSTAHLKMLQSLSGKLNRLNDLPQIGEVIVRELLTLLDYHACRVYVRDDDALLPIAHRHEFSARDGSDVTLQPLEIGDGVAGHAAEIRTSLLLENALECEFAQQLPGTEAVPESMIATPLLFDGEAIGVVIVTKLGVAQFDGDDVRLLEVLAGHAAVAVQNAALYAAERREAERAKGLLVRSNTMLGLSHELVSAHNTGDVARLTAKAMVSTLGCESATVWLQSTPGAVLQLVGKDELHDGAPTLPTWVIGRVADGAAFWLNRRDVAKLACFEGGPASLAVAPIQLPNHRFGCVVAGLDEGTTTREDLRLLDGIVDQAQLALTNADRFASLESMFVSTVESLANALEANDELTSSHARAIRDMAVAVARDLGLEDAALKQVELAALFHDIGKIGVPTHVLSKPGPLTEDERGLIERHPEIGQRILDPIEELAGIGTIVLHCHERYDGRGYPHGLSDDDIPLEARIVFVCDAWHAMTSDRPYRRALPTAVAREELRAAAGTQFDPAVVAVFLRALADADSS